MIKEIQRSINALNVGNSLLYPTDTVWGIGCDALNKTAISTVYKIKERSDTKSMLVLVSDIEMLRLYVEEIPDSAFVILSEATKPTTIIYPRAKNLPANLVNPNGSIGIRITNESFSNALVTALGRPIVSTSANISGQPAAGVFNEVSQNIKERVSYIVDYRQNETEKAAPSAIVLVNTNGTVTFLRQ